MFGNNFAVLNFLRSSAVRETGSPFGYMMSKIIRSLKRQMLSPKLALKRRGAVYVFWRDHDRQRCPPALGESPASHAPGALSWWGQTTSPGSRGKTVGITSSVDRRIGSGIWQLQLCKQMRAFGSCEFSTLQVDQPPIFQQGLDECVGHSAICGRLFIHEDKSENLCYISADHIQLDWNRYSVLRKMYMCAWLILHST